MFWEVEGWLSLTKRLIQNLGIVVFSWNLVTVVTLRRWAE